jgi:hypothetical protein
MYFCVSVQREGQDVLLNLEDLTTLLYQCKIPGLDRKNARNSIKMATGASAPQAFANMMNNDATAQSIRAGAAAGGAAGPSVADAVPTDVTLGGIMAFMTDMRTDVQTTNTNVVGVGDRVVKVQRFVKEIDNRVTKIDARVTAVDTRVTVVGNRVSAWQATYKREQKGLLGNINAALQAMDDEQMQKDAARDAAQAQKDAAQAQKDVARDAEIERLKQAGAARDAVIETLQQKEAARKDDEDNMQMAVFVDVVQPSRVDKRKRETPVRYGDDASSQPKPAPTPTPKHKPKPKPARDSVVQDAIYAYALEHWGELVFKTKSRDDFVYITDMIAELEKRGVPGKLTEPQIKRLMRRVHKARPVDINWTPPSDEEPFRAKGFRRFTCMSPAAHAQFCASLERAQWCADM